MQCPACAGENANGAKFCGSCGLRLTTGAPIVEPDGAAKTRPLSALAEREEGSLQSSPIERGVRTGRTLVISLMVAIDIALVIAGVMMMRGSGVATREGDGAESLSTGSTALDPGSLDGEPGGAARVRGDSAELVARSWVKKPSGTPGEDRSDGDAPVSVIARNADVSAVPADESAPNAAMANPETDTAIAKPATDAAMVPADAGGVVESDTEPLGVASAQEIAAHLAKLVVRSGTRLTRCYEHATNGLPADEPLVGEVDIGLAVLPTGGGSNVRVLRNTTGSEDLAQCVLVIAQGWTYPAHDEGDAIEFVRPFRFGPQ
jgi:hypothetical protein